MAQQEELVLWIDRRWKNAIEKHLNGETLQERKLPHGAQRKKRPALMPLTM